MEQKTGNRKKSSALSGVIVSLVLLAGLALVLYPTVADKINDASNHKIIAAYQEKAEQLDNATCQKLLDEARAYNEALAMTTPYITELTAARRAVYQNLLDLDGSGVMGYVDVPKAKVTLAIYHGTEERVLQTGAGHIEASSLPVPGESVHTVLAGHSGLPSARLFTDLDQLKPGDTFTLHVLREALTYRVEKIERRTPDELKSLRIEPGQELCTLMTCTPYGINTHRLVITGRRVPTPADPPQEDRPTVQIIASKWHRWFVLLPVAVFAVLTAAAVLLLRRQARRNRLKAAKSPENPNPPRNPRKSE